MKKILSVKMPLPLSEALCGAAKEAGVSASEIIREAVAEYLAKPHTVEPGSALHVAGDLAGSLRGPADLATNKKHLKGFGR